jgi:predicted nuclease of predicted toxin-antitoxin system
VKLLLDEHHSPKVAAQLVKAGFDVVAASSQENTCNIVDEELLTAATADDRAIVTENIADFIPLAARWAADRRPHHGMILTHPERFNRRRSSYPGSLVRALKAFLNDPPHSGDSWVWWL